MTTVLVQATQWWQRSGVTLADGEQVRIQSRRGLWACLPSVPLCSAAGHPGTVAPAHSPWENGPMGALVGRIGQTVFPIGEESVSPPGLSGPLELMINDPSGGLRDNRGAIHVEITPLPEPSTLRSGLRGCLVHPPLPSLTPGGPEQGWEVVGERRSVNGVGDAICSPPFRLCTRAGFAISTRIRFVKTGCGDFISVGGHFARASLYLDTGGGLQFYPNGSDRMFCDCRVTIGRWYDLLALVEPDGTARVYVDGKQIAEEKHWIPDSNTVQCFVGQNVNDTSSSWPESFRGEVEYVRVFEHSRVDELLKPSAVPPLKRFAPPAQLMLPPGGMTVRAISLRFTSTGDGSLYNTICCTLDGGHRKLHLSASNPPSIMLDSESHQSSPIFLPLSLNWNHVTMVLEAGRIRAFLNGQFAREVSCPGLNDFHVDRLILPPLPGIKLADIALWHKAPSDADILRLATTGLRASEPDCLLHWPLEEGAGLAVRDRILEAPGTVADTWSREEVPWPRIVRSTVIARQRWQRTGLTLVKQGTSRVRLEASGHCSTGTTPHSPAGEGGPAGKDFLLPTAPRGALIGRLGPIVFPIGTGAECPPVVGPLFLAINSKMDDRGDHSGQLAASIILPPDTLAILPRPALRGTSPVAQAQVEAQRDVAAKMSDTTSRINKAHDDAASRMKKAQDLARYGYTRLFIAAENPSYHTSMLTTGADGSPQPVQPWMPQGLAPRRVTVDPATRTLYLAGRFSGKNGYEDRVGVARQSFEALATPNSSRFAYSPYLAFLDKKTVFNGTDAYREVPYKKVRTGNGFMIAARVRFDAAGTFARVVDLGQGPDQDNIFLSLHLKTRKINFSVYQGNARTSLISSSEVPLGTYIDLLAVVEKDGRGRLFIDGKEEATDQLRLPYEVERARSYIGKSNYHDDALFKGEMEYVRFYEHAMWGEVLEQPGAPSSSDGHDLLDLEVAMGDRMLYLLAGRRIDPSSAAMEIYRLPLKDVEGAAPGDRIAIAAAVQVCTCTVVNVPLHEFQGGLEDSWRQFFESWQLELDEIRRRCYVLVPKIGVFRGGFEARTLELMLPDRGAWLRALAIDEKNAWMYLLEGRAPSLCRYGLDATSREEVIPRIDGDDIVRETVCSLALDGVQGMAYCLRTTDIPGRGLQPGVKAFDLLVSPPVAVREFQVFNERSAVAFYNPASADRLAALKIAGAQAATMKDFASAAAAARADADTLRAQKLKEMQAAQKEADDRRADKQREMDAKVQPHRKTLEATQADSTLQLILQSAEGVRQRALQQLQKQKDIDSANDDAEKIKAPARQKLADARAKQG